MVSLCSLLLLGHHAVAARRPKKKKKPTWCVCAGHVTIPLVSVPTWVSEPCGGPHAHMATSASPLRFYQEAQHYLGRASAPSKHKEIKAASGVGPISRSILSPCPTAGGPYGNFTRIPPRRPLNLSAFLVFDFKITGN